MSYELRDVMGRLEEDRNGRGRPTEQRWRDLNHLDDEEVVELTTAAYEEASESIYKAVRCMPEDEQDNILLGISPLFTGVASSKQDWDQETTTLWYDARLDLSELAASYTFIADYAYHKFEQEASEGKPGMLLGLITAMQDPMLARKLLKELPLATMLTHTSSYAQERAAKASSLKTSMKSYSKQEWTEEVRTTLNSDNMGVMGALVLKRKVRLAIEKGKGENKRYKAYVINPLQQISELPPVSIQLLYRALGGRPKDEFSYGGARRT